MGKAKKEKVTQQEKDLIFIKSWLKDTYMQDSEILEYNISRSEENHVKHATLKINFNNNIIKMKIDKDKTRAETYSETEKMQIDGYGLRRIFERGC